MRSAISYDTPARNQADLTKPSDGRKLGIKVLKRRLASTVVLHCVHRDL